VEWRKIVPHGLETPATDQIPTCSKSKGSNNLNKGTTINRFNHCHTQDNQDKKMTSSQQTKKKFEIESKKTKVSEIDDIFASSKRANKFPLSRICRSSPLWNY
jgi:hypothetical protein